MERAASTTPGSTLIKFCSTMRATANVAPMVMAKIAALGPNRAHNGLCGLAQRAASRMMNGMGWMKFNNRFSAVKDRGVLQDAVPGG